MKNLLQETIESLWPGEAPAPQAPSTSGLGAKPGFRPARTPAEVRADETTRMAREITDTAAEDRRVNADRLRQARLEKEAEACAMTAPAPPEQRVPSSWRDAPTCLEDHHMPIHERLLYASENGDHWSLARDPGTGRVVVRHKPNLASGGRACDLEVGEFLMRGGLGPEKQELLRLIGDLVETDDLMAGVGN